MTNTRADQGRQADEQAPGAIPGGPAGRPQPLPKRIISWLATLHGMLSGLAAVIIAAGALFVAVRQIGGSDDDAAAATQPTASLRQAGGPQQGGARPQSGAPPATVEANRGGTAATPPSSSRVWLYSLPATSSGLPGKQTTPFDVNIAGNGYAHSTGVPVSCSGPQTVVTFFLGGKYTKLSAMAGLAAEAPTDLNVRLHFYVDDALWRWTSVTHDGPAAIDYDISGSRTLQVTASASACADNTARPFAYLGDATVS